MKFMIQWSIDQDKWLPMLEMWGGMTPEERTDAGPGVTIIGRWHDFGGRTGVAIVEAEDAQALSAYAVGWNPHMEVDITPVLDDDEAGAVAQAMTTE